VSVRVAPLGERHLAEVVRIERGSYPNPWSLDGFRRELRSGPVSVCRAALSDPEPGETRLLGYAFAHVVADEMKINNVSVAPEVRRRGIGRALMNDLLALARARGCRHVTLEVRVGNAPALSLYRSLGFRDVGRRPGYYQPEGEDALLMALTLLGAG
jgi:ribosomal-protein-alanine N-acetyltransferase